MSLERTRQVLLGLPNPVVVLAGSRLRCGRHDHDFLEDAVVRLRAGAVPVGMVTFRTRGMIIGPQSFIEEIAPKYGHEVEVDGLLGNTPEKRVHLLNKRDGIPPSALLDAHALWLWVTPSELGTILENPAVILAQEFGVSVFLFLPESRDFEVVELV